MITVRLNVQSKTWKVFPLCRPWDEDCEFSGCQSPRVVLLRLYNALQQFLHAHHLTTTRLPHPLLSFPLSLCTHTGSPICSYIHTGLAMNTSPLTTTPYTNTDAYTYTFLHETIPDASLWFPFTYSTLATISNSEPVHSSFLYEYIKVNVTKNAVTWQLHLKWCHCPWNDTGSCKWHVNSGELSCHAYNDNFHSEASNCNVIKRQIDRTSIRDGEASLPLNL